MNELRDLIEEIQRRANSARATLGGDMGKLSATDFQAKVDDARTDLEQIDWLIDRARYGGVIPK